VSDAREPDVSRRRLLGSLFGRAARAAEPQPPIARPSGRGRGLFPVIRPPGAVPEAQFLERCTRCNECVEACPHDAITHAPPRFRHAAGTPMIDAAAAPCRMCDDFPCIAACPEAALVPDDIGPIAIARLLDYNCLAHQGSFCTVCSEHCPEPGAIEVQDGKPTIVEGPCTGCGICHHVCPAPTNAVAMMPRPFENPE